MSNYQEFRVRKDFPAGGDVWNALKLCLSNPGCSVLISNDPGYHNHYIVQQWLGNPCAEPHQCVGNLPDIG